MAPAHGGPAQKGAHSSGARQALRAGGVSAVQVHTQALGQHVLQHGGGDLLNRLVRARQPLHPGAAHHGLSLGHFVAAVLQAGVVRVGAALVADLGQALWVDGQAKQLLADGLQRRRQLLVETKSLGLFLASFDSVRFRFLGLGKVYPI